MAIANSCERSPRELLPLVKFLSLVQHSPGSFIGVGNWCSVAENAFLPLTFLDCAKNSIVAIFLNFKKAFENAKKIR